MIGYDRLGAGAPLLLLHPVGLDRTFWGPLLPAAAAAGNEVIALDLRGHGQTDAAATATQISDYAADVLRLLDELGFAQATLLGLSFGGMIAQEVAVEAPDRVARLVVGACGGAIAEANRAAVRARGAAALQHGMAAIVEPTLERWFTPPFLGSPQVARVRERLLGNRREHWAAAWEAIAGFDAEARLHRIRIPTLVLAGELDAGTPAAVTKDLARAIPGAEFEQISGAPHMMQIECADRFLHTVHEFLNRTAPGR